MSKVWTKETIRAAIQSNPTMVERSILKLWERQTESEKVEHATNNTNARGFNSVDAFILTSFAEWLQKSWKAEGTKLSEKQLVIARKKLMKYAGQLLEVHTEKTQTKIEV